MKKTFYFLGLLAFVSLLCLLYQYGKYRGYKIGFDEGYSYDCRAELNNVAKYAHDIKKGVKATSDSLKEMNKRISNPSYNRAQLYIDSLQKAGFRGDTNIYYDGGYISIGQIRLPNKNKATAK